MERDSFENQLRYKVLQAELRLNQDANKEKVWNDIQKKRNPKRKLYYAAAAVLLIVGALSLLYIKNNQSQDQFVENKPKEKTRVSNLQREQVLQEKVIEKQPLATLKDIKDEKQISGELEQLAISSSGINLPTQVTPIMLSQLADEKIVALQKAENAENRVVPMPTSTTIPEFTVQLKRGAAIADNTSDNLIITTLKKFKLKRDTTYFANAEEKQSTKIKLTFKKEN